MSEHVAYGVAQCLQVGQQVLGGLCTAGIGKCVGVLRVARNQWCDTKGACTDGLHGEPRNKA